jgi:hypothetical protein
MKRKSLFAAVFTSMLFLSVLVESLFVNLAEANPIYQQGMLTVAIINSPENKTYTTSIIPLEIVTGDHQLSSSGFYRVDGGPEIRINENAWQSATLRGELNLTEGSHSIFVKTVTVGSACAVVYFTIDTIAPSFLVQSPETVVYNVTDVELNFIVDEPTSWIGYCLDGQANVTLTGNSALTKLPSGLHTLTIYANDMVGDMGASSINFSIAELFQTTLAIASASIVTVIAVGLLVYFKKRQKLKSARRFYLN